VAVTDWVAGIDPTAVDGITISGGEPFEQPAALLALTRWLRGHFGDASVDILVYSGYPQATVEAEHPEVLATIDALVSEPYRQNATGPQLRWRGSPNQRLIPLSPLGHQRYAEHLDAPADTGLQFDVRDGEVHLIGVPRPGDLRRLEDGLARRGVTLGERSWARPSGTGGG
jgi:anaerobic ribonucleoside-triphosphate reductase activating protein